MSKTRYLILTSLIAAASLTACSNAKEQLGIARSAPDEFAVVKRAPLEMPPDYSLRPPRPGAPRPQETAVGEQAREAVFGADDGARKAAPAEAQEPRFLYPDGTMRVAAWQLFGSLFFGAVNKLEELLDPRVGHPEVVILDMTRLIQLDTTGLEGLESLLDKLHKRGCTLIVCGLNSQPGSLLFRSGFIDHLGDDNVAADLSQALERAYVLLPGLMSDDEYC